MDEDDNHGIFRLELIARIPIFWFILAIKIVLKVIYHPLYGMNDYVLIWGYMGGYHVKLSEGHMIANHPIYGVIGYHVTVT